MMTNVSEKLPAKYSKIKYEVNKIQLHKYTVNKVSRQIFEKYLISSHDCVYIILFDYYCLYNGEYFSSKISETI